MPPSTSELYSRNRLAEPEDRLQTAKETLKKTGRNFHPHQIEGIQWMMNLEAQGLGGLLADDPGLGKTYQALSLVATSPPGCTSLIIVPTSILKQWESVAIELLGEFAVYLHHGPRRQRPPPQGMKCILTTFGLIRAEEELRQAQWYRVIVDEAHIAKNSASKTSKALRELDTSFRWSLTGTPVQNARKELVNLFKWVRGDGPDDNSPLDVETWVKDHLLRRRKEIVLEGKLPDIDVESTAVPFQSDREAKFYEIVQRNVKREWVATANQCLTAQEENVIMFELLLRLRQAAQHPHLVLQGYARKFKKQGDHASAQKMKDSMNTKWKDYVSSKHNYLLESLQRDQTRDESSLVFCQFTEEIKILEKLLIQKGIPCRSLHGGVCVDTRASILREVDTIQTPIVLLIQIKAGGVGLNLQKFSCVYLTSPDWNPSNEIQAMARAHRIGQNKRVLVKRLVLQTDKTTDDGKPVPTIDDKILAIQEDKRTLMALLLKEGALRSNGRDTRKRVGLTQKDYKRLLK